MMDILKTNVSSNFDRSLNKRENTFLGIQNLIKVKKN